MGPSNGFDLDEQVLPADVRLQVDHLALRAQRGVKLGLNERQIRAVAHVDLVGQRLHAESRRVGHAVGFAEKRFYVDEGLARLGSYIACVYRLMTDDARGARYEEDRTRCLAKHTCAGERRLGAILWRIFVC